jgi:hypothetical protein
VKATALRIRPYRGLIAVAAIGLLLTGRPALAQIGNRYFYGSMVTEDPDPGNSLGLAPAWYTTQAIDAFSLNFSIEKQFTDITSLQINDAWNAESCTDPAICIAQSFNRHHHQVNRTQGGIGNVGNGFDNMQILGKLVIATSVPHEFRIAIGPNLFLSSGNTRAGADTHTYAGPIAMLAKGMGDIPNGGVVRLLRPLAIQADCGTLFKTGGTQENEWYSDFAVGYDFSYLSSYVKDVAVPPWLAHFVPFSELTAAGLFYQSTGGATPDFRVVPGVAYILGDYTFTLATEIALNQGSVAYDHSSVLTAVGLPLSILDPRLASPLFQ